MLQSWHDRKLELAKDWDEEIDTYLRSADLVLLLLSKDFIASGYIWRAEVKIAMQRHASGDARAVPILARALDFEPDEAPFLKLRLDLVDSLSETS